MIKHSNTKCVAATCIEFCGLDVIAISDYYPEVQQAFRRGVTAT